MIQLARKDLQQLSAGVATAHDGSHKVHPVVQEIFVELGKVLCAERDVIHHRACRVFAKHCGKMPSIVQWLDKRTNRIFHLPRFHRIIASGL